MARHIRPVTFRCTIGSANNTQTFPFKFENSIKKVLGFQIIGIPSNKFPLYRGKFGLILNAREVFVNDTPAQLYISGSQCPPDDRYSRTSFKDALEVSNGDIKFTYTDADNPNAAFGTGYEVLIEFECEYEG